MTYAIAPHEATANNMVKTLYVLSGLCLTAILVFTAWAQLAPTDDGGTWGFETVAAYSHDPDAFTQGLLVHDGALLESTGQYGASTLRRVDLESGRVLQMTPLSRTHFGEGIAVAGDNIYQLTWQNRLVLVYDVETLERTGSLRNEGEGWGLTYDGSLLIMSDGSATLTFRDPDTFSIVRELNVYDSGSAVRNLNELEYIHGEIWANIWYRDEIARISPETGAVLGWIDLSALYPQSQRGSEDVLNGIAYDVENERLFVTGKNWPQLFEITVGP